MSSEELTPGTSENTKRNHCVSDSDRPRVLLVVTDDDTSSTCNATKAADIADRIADFWRAHHRSYSAVYRWELTNCATLPSIMSSAFAATATTVLPASELIEAIANSDTCGEGELHVDIVGSTLTPHAIAENTEMCSRITIFADLISGPLPSSKAAVTHSPYWTFACYTASRHGTNPHFATAAAELASTLAAGGHGIVYGGGNCGLMGVVADAALAGGASVYGVIPHHFDGHEVEHRGLTRLEIVDSMATRKTRMAELADCFIALPGGVGTLEEFFEVWAHRQLAIHHKPVVLYNIDHYWDSLLEALREYAEQDILSQELLDDLIVVSTPTELLERLSLPQPSPHLRKP